MPIALGGKAPRASQAYEGPWCALSEIGGNAMYENCNIPTFELCVQEVIAGNRGFCNPNRAGKETRPAPGRTRPAASVPFN